MGGPSQQTQDRQAQITQQQLDLAKTSQQQSQADTERRVALEQPLIDRELKLASGDRSAAVAAAMPTITELSKGYAAAKENVFNVLPPGPARDKALADIEVQKYSGTASAVAGEVQKAPAVLANVGQGVGAFSLQELGAAFSGYQGAAGTNESLSGMENAKKANSLSFFSSLAGAAGSAAGGYLARPAKV